MKTMIELAAFVPALVARGIPLRRTIATATLLLVAVPAVAPAQQARMVEAQTRTSTEWKPYPTRLLEDLSKSVAAETAPALDQYGGLLVRKAKATGFCWGISPTTKCR